MAQPGGRATTSYGGSPAAGREPGGNLGDILERVLDKGLVIAGDIRVNLLDIELLTIKLRLVIASVETARELGINWWETDPWLTSDGPGRRQLEELTWLEQTARGCLRATRMSHPVPRQAGATAARPDRIALVDLLDRVLAGGVVITGEVRLAVADVDMVRLSLQVLIASVSASPGEVPGRPPHE